MQGLNQYRQGVMDLLMLVGVNMFEHAYCMGVQSLFSFSARTDLAPSNSISYCGHLTRVDFCTHAVRNQGLNRAANPCFIERESIG